MINESTSPDSFGDAASWKASAENGGSPGRAEVVQPFLAVSANNGALLIQCTGKQGVIYILQQTGDLSASNWQTIDNQVAPASGQVTFAPALTGGSRFYRVTSP